MAATRPAFLIVTLAASLLGVASAAASGARIDPVAATLALVFALVAHAGVNVLNDYFDARNGSDACNSERLFPFTGGSRLLQNCVLSLRAPALRRDHQDAVSHVRKQAHKVRRVSRQNHLRPPLPRLGIRQVDQVIKQPAQPTRMQARLRLL